MFVASRSRRPAPSRPRPTRSRAYQRHVDANRAAAHTVVLKGRVWSDPEACSSRSPIRRNRACFPTSLPTSSRGQFTFFAADGGKKKRWDKTYDVKDIGVDERQAIDGELVYDALDPDRGYLRTAREFLSARSDNVDFYRDHWFDEDHPDAGGDHRFPEESRLHQRPGIRRTAGRSSSLDRPPPGSPSDGSPGPLDAESSRRWGTWCDTSRARIARPTRPDGRGARILATKIWYPAMIKRWYLFRYPDGSESSETIVLLVRGGEVQRADPRMRPSRSRAWD